MVLAAPLALALFGAGACRSVYETVDIMFMTSDIIEYDEYLAIDTQANPKLTVDDVMKRLGQPASIHDRDGARRRIDYRAFSTNDDLKRAHFQFDKNEKLEKKEMW